MRNDYRGRGMVSNMRHAGVTAREGEESEGLGVT